MSRALFNGQACEYTFPSAIAAGYGNVLESDGTGGTTWTAAPQVISCVLKDNVGATLGNVNAGVMRRKYSSTQDMVTVIFEGIAFSATPTSATFASLTPASALPPPAILAGAFACFNNTGTLYPATAILLSTGLTVELYFGGAYAAAANMTFPTFSMTYLSLAL